MRQKFHALIAALLFLAVVIAPVSLANAQAPTLQEQLAAQYKLVKMGSDTGGYAVVEAGTLLAIQKGGILAVPYGDKTVLTTKYEGGAVHTPSGLMVQGRKALFGHFSQTQSEGQTTHLFAKGDKVYPTKIDVNVAKDVVTLSIVACDTCNKTDPPTYNKAQVAFQFPAGTLAKASAGQVEDTIGQLLSISSDDQQQGGDQGGQQGGDQGAGQGQGQGQGQAKRNNKTKRPPQSRNRSKKARLPIR